MPRIFRFVVPFVALASVALAQKPPALGEDPAPVPSRPGTPSRPARPAAPQPDQSGKPAALGEDTPAPVRPSARPPAASRRPGATTQPASPSPAQRPGPQPIPEGGTGGKPAALDDDSAAAPPPASRPGSTTRRGAAATPPDLSGKPAALSEEEARRQQSRSGRSGQYRTVSTGTGFVVADRRVLTNNHVVSSCQRVSVRTSNEQMLEATVLATDANRDLAILNVQGNPGPVLSFRGQPDIRRGEDVVTYGFPLTDILSSGPTLTTGNISALAGMRDNQLHYQISAPVQPGNSGGPLLDLQGHVVGVIVSKLAAMRIAERTGDIPQNVNFAIKGTEAATFLREHNITPRLVSANGANRSSAEVGEIAHPSTLLIHCQRRR